MRSLLALGLALLSCAGRSSALHAQAPAPTVAATSSSGPPVAPPVERTKWVGTWITAPQLTEPGNLPPPPGLWGNTLRQVVHVSVGGSRLRLALSNEFGTRPYTLSAVHVAVSRGQDAIEPSTDRALAFGGSPSVRVEPGKSVVSDPFDFELAPLSELAVTVLTDASGPSEHTGHPGSLTTVHADSPEGALEQIAFMTLQAGLTLTRADVIEYAKSVVDIVVQLGRVQGKRTVSSVVFHRRT